MGFRYGFFVSLLWFLVFLGFLVFVSSFSFVFGFLFWLHSSLSLGGVVFFFVCQAGRPEPPVMVTVPAFSYGFSWVLGTFREVLTPVNTVLFPLWRCGRTQ